jgi:hypothetical protein
MISAGDVYDYPYLWKRQQLNHETEGRKPRPCAFIAAIADPAGNMNLFILAITGSSGGNGKAVEIPALEKRRAGLDGHKQLWIIIDEYNHDIEGKSFYFEASQKRGQFSAPFTKHVLEKFRELVHAKTVSSVSRTK